LEKQKNAGIGFEVVGETPDVFAKAMRSYIRGVSEIGRRNNLEIE
jgi:hypothetical protein